MGRSQRLYCRILIGFFIWFLIFYGQLIYFNWHSVTNSCRSSTCRDLSTNKFKSNSIENFRIQKKKTMNVNSLPDSVRQPLLLRYVPLGVNLFRFTKLSNDTGKYLVYLCNKPCGGWGDRTRKIVGAFLLSLALNRTFIIRMNWPCPLTQLLEPNIIPWNVEIPNENQRTNLTVYKLTANDNDYRQLLLWKNIDVIYFPVKDLAYYSLLLWRDDLYRVLYYKYGLHRSILFLHSVFTLIYELLFKLKSHPQSHLDFISNKFHLDSLRCAHIRIGRNPSNPNDIIFPKRERMNKTVIAFLHNISKADDMIFVSTDSQDVQNYARQQFSSRFLTIDGLIQHIDRSGRHQSCNGFEKTVLDFYMISFCQTMIMSKSAFR